jgi:hypothetical protein
VPLNNTEIWEISNSGNFGHPFHIHDVEFNILSVNGAAPDASQAGWKDVVFVPAKSGGTASVVKFIAKFDDYADALHPFMYHCHIALHEDEGMMGQFVVTNATALDDINNKNIPVTLFPNPTNNRLYILFGDVSQSAYYITISDYLGRTKLMLPKPELENGIDISHLSKGVYNLTIIENNSKKSITQSFIVN